MAVPEPTLTWLHLSDAHIGDPRHAPDAEHVLGTLSQDLRVMQRDRGLRPDLVFFTGDAAFGELREAPLEQQYREVSRFFDGVCAAFDPPIPRSRVFIVPGNHDVNRNEASEDQRAWLEHLLHNGEPAEDKVDALLRKGDVQWKRFMERLQPYASFLENAGYSHLLTDPRRLTYVHKLDLHGQAIGILGLNTAWSCSDDNAKGRVWLGAWQLTSAQSQLRDCALKIVLSHHPFNWLTEREDPRIGRQVSQMFDFHLHGHEHEDWVVEEHEHMRIAAGACYDRISKLNGYNFTRLDFGTGTTEIHLRCYDRQGRGWVPRCIHGRTSDRGIWTVQRRRRDAELPARRSSAPPPPAPRAVRRALAAHDYFSPAREIKDAEKFVGRRKELVKAVGALRSEGASIAIFGYAGLGKTSLAFQIAHVASGDHHNHLENLGLTQLVPEDGFAHPVVYYCCQRKDQTVAEVLASVLRDSHPPFSMRALLQRKAVVEELSSAESRELAAQIEAIRSSAAQVEAEATPKVPAGVHSVFCGVAAAISKAHEGRALVVVLDEFNLVADKSGMAGLLKELHFVTFVLVGTAVDVRMLVKDHASVSRQLEEGQIRIREMNASDLEEIVRREESRARGAFHFDSAALHEIVQTASGMPYFVHLLGRYALAEALAVRDPEACRESQVSVRLEHVQSALAKSAEHMADLEAFYFELMRGSWQREFVLKLLACRAEAEIAISNITPIARTQGVASVRSQVNYFVKQGVLEVPYENTVRFRDPRLRVFARLRTPIDDANRRRIEFVRAAELRNSAADWVFPTTLTGAARPPLAADVLRRAGVRRGKENRSPGS